MKARDPELTNPHKNHNNKTNNNNNNNNHKHSPEWPYKCSDSGNTSGPTPMTTKTWRKLRVQEFLRSGGCVIDFVLLPRPPPTLTLSLSLCLSLLFPLGSFSSPDTNQRHRSRTCRGHLTLAAHKSPQASIMYRNVATWPPLPTSLHSPAPVPLPLPLL